MRRLFRNRWLVVLLIWTAFLAVPAVQLWPAANTPTPPCNYHGSGVQDPALQTCPPDGANYEAIGMSLLVVLWLAGVTIGLTALGISRLVGKRRERVARPGEAPTRR
jgi:hypothetical protein